MSAATVTQERRTEIRPDPSQGMYSKLVFITPDMSERWLKLNTRNRHLSAIKAREIIADWEDETPTKDSASHQGVAFYAKDGALADGQTRLYACWKSGIPFWSMVTWGVPEKAARFIDRHRARSEADVIRIAGLSDWIERDELSLVKMIVAAHKKGTHSYPVSVLVKIGEAIKEPIQFAEEAFAGRRLKNVTVSPVLAAIAIASPHVDQVRLLEFAEVLITGISESHDDMAAIKLRDKLISEGSQAGQTARRIILLKTMRAIKAFVDREKLEQLRTPKEMIYHLSELESLI